MKYSFLFGLLLFSTQSMAADLPAKSVPAIQSIVAPTVPTQPLHNYTSNGHVICFLSPERSEYQQCIWINNNGDLQNYIVKISNFGIMYNDIDDMRLEFNVYADGFDDLLGTFTNKEVSELVTNEQILLVNEDNTVVLEPVALNNVVLSQKSEMTFVNSPWHPTAK